jgi:lipopolysaccharide transport system permease protein
MRRVVYIRDVLWVLIVRDLKVRYKRSLLGLGWSLLNPLAQLLVLQFVFGILLESTIPHFAAFLFTGILAWTWFQSSLLTATGVIVDNRDLIKRPAFPMAVLPLIAITSEMIHFLLAIPVLLAVVVLDGVPLTSAIAAFPLVVTVQFIFTVSLAYVIASLQVSFGDTKYLLGILLQLLFFSTGIFFDIKEIAPAYQPWLQLNPMVHLIEAYREIFLAGQLPAVEPLLVLLLCSLVLLWVGYRRFLGASYYFVEAL